MSCMLAYFSQTKGSLPQVVNEDDKGFLPHLGAECKAIRRITEREDVGLRYVYRESDDCTVANIANDLSAANEQDNVVIFHYSGHADTDRIFLQQDAADAEGLANLLGQCPNLRLVFLNGCSTKSHVYHLFKNKVPFVVATNYKVRDIEAYDFAKVFYTNLLTNRFDIQRSYRTAVGSIAASVNLRTLLPEELLAQPPTLTASLEISGPTRGGGFDINQPTGPVWGLHAFNENDAMLTGPWRPKVKRAATGDVVYERAYTCGRQSLSDEFATHWGINSRKRRILHYFLADDESKSMEGVSIKALYEHITQSYPSDRMPQRFFPCDPVNETFRKSMVTLSGANQSKSEIIHQICKKVGIEDYVPDKSDYSFKDLYALPQIKLNSYSFIFIAIPLKSFVLIKKAIEDLLEESVKVDSSGATNRPMLLFFWHVNTKSAFSLNPLEDKAVSLRSAISKEFIAKYPDTAMLLHEESEKGIHPIPLPCTDDLKKWIGDNNDKIERVAELEKLLKEHKSVVLLENELREILKRKSA
jgi:hypothetical protein